MNPRTPHQRALRAHHRASRYLRITPLHRSVWWFGAAQAKQFG